MNDLPFLTSLTIALTVCLAQIPALGTTGSDQPTEYEQYMLQVINRARANGAAEMVRLGNASPGNVNEGPPTLGPDTWTILNAAPPLAWSTKLAAAAQSHANNLQSADWFFNGSLYGNNPHSPNASFPAGASTVASRITAAGYSHTNSGCRVSTNFYLPGRENISSGVRFPSTGWTGAKILAAFNEAHEGLFEDYTVPSRGHRSTMMYECFREVGIGTATGTDLRTSDNTTWDSYYIVQNFGRSSIVTNPILTGMAYNDLDSNNFFTPNAGESIANLTVQALQSGNVVASTAAFATGGYALPLAAGTYEIRFVRPDSHFYSAGNVTLTTNNVELNARSPIFSLTYSAWIAGYPEASNAPGFFQDADGDSIPNGLEHLLGTSPVASSIGLYQVSRASGNLVFRHSRSNSIASDVSSSYQWSTNLTNWQTSGQTFGGVTVSITNTTIVDNNAPATDTIQVTASVTSGTPARLFLRLIATSP